MPCSYYVLDIDLCKFGGKCFEGGFQIIAARDQWFELRREALAIGGEDMIPRKGFESDRFDHVHSFEPDVLYKFLPAKIILFFGGCCQMAKRASLGVRPGGVACRGMRARLPKIAILGTNPGIGFRIRRRCGGRSRARCRSSVFRRSRRSETSHALLRSKTILSSESGSVEADRESDTRRRQGEVAITPYRCFLTRCPGPRPTS